MNKTKVNKTEVIPAIYTREFYVKKTTLFGLLSWEELVRTEYISNDLIIRTEKEPNKIIWNVKVLWEKDNKE